MQNLSILKIVSSLILFGFLFSNLELSAQQLNGIDERKVLEKHQIIKTEFKKREVKFLKTKSRNVFLRYNPISLAFGGALFFYQKVISQQIAANCPYEISCSAFSKQCIQKYGFIKGVALSADRLTRCTQFTMIDLSPININNNQKIIDSVETYSNHRLRHKHAER